MIATPPNQKFSYIYLSLLLLCLAIAFWLRWQFVQRVNLYPDEFVTLLAMDMIGQKGVPVLPSGLFYEHGLLYSYLAGAVALLGEPAFLGRMTSLTLGLTTITLTYFLGRRWFSDPVGLLAAVGLTLASSAIHWHGRVRMYALLQLFVLLTIWFMMDGLFRYRVKSGWLAVLSYIGALYTQFVALALLPPLTVAEILGFLSQSAHKGWYRNWRIALRGVAIGGAVLGVILLKRYGQPKGIEPLAADNAVSGLWQIVTIYSSFSFDVGPSWLAISPFFLAAPNLLFSAFALVAIVSAFWQKPRYGPTLFLTVVLFGTTLEVVLLAPADRQDDKYVFMLLPLLFLLGGQGMMVVTRGLFQKMRRSYQPFATLGLTIGLAIGLGLYSRSEIDDLLTNVGEDYETTFSYVAENLQPDEAILTGTPAAAYYYLGRNDYYAVQAGGIYDYRILQESNGDLVERWLGSPWLQTPEALYGVLQKQPVWLILERWGLLVEYYDPYFMQSILAQTDFIREDNGIIALKSVSNPVMLPEAPTVPAEVLLNGVEGDTGQLLMRGYALTESQLTLFWEPIAPLSFDYTVFVNIQNQAGETVWQQDHRPLGSVYPTTLWPVEQLIRETTRLDLPAGNYELRVGMYLLETGERLWVPSDETSQNMVYLGSFVVESR